MKIAEWIEVEDVFLMNKPAHGPMPRGQPWEFYLWARRCSRFRARIRGKVREWVTRRNYLHTISAPTRAGANAELKKFMGRLNVRLV